VEKALMKWGRFSPAMDATNADLVISFRRGHGTAVSNTIAGVPKDGPVIMAPIDSGIRIGAQQGTPPSVTAGSPHPARIPRPKLDQQRTRSSCIAKKSSMPSMAVRSGRYIAKDALSSPSVPAVAQLQKVIAAKEAVG
jgi:hypothetical protein